MFILVTGGSGSGKSEYAENRAVELSRPEGLKLSYIATMFPFDQESRERILRHRAMRRDKHFITWEQYTDLKSLCLPEKGVVLLECMSNLVANEIYRPEGAGEKAVEEIWAGVRGLLEKCVHLVVVTNEIFSDGIHYGEETRWYQLVLGEINGRMAGRADQVVEVVYGIPVVHKEGQEGVEDETALE